jgi:hypothetical protein
MRRRCGVRSARALTGVAFALGLGFAPPAHAVLNLSQTSDAIVVTGDGGASQILVQDGDTSGGNNYAFAFYSETGETVNLGSSGCISDGGAPVENIYCGTGTFNNAVFNLGSGDDRLGSFNDSMFDVLGTLTVDLGAGSDENEGGAFYGIPTIFRGGDGDDDLAGQEGPTSVVEGGPGTDRMFGGGAPSGETLRGGPGNDDINGLVGNDAIFGDEGDDGLIGGADGDTITGGPGLDNVQGDATANAFSGNDTIRIADGERDVAACGFGADTVEADSLDLLPVEDCESVTRSGGGGGGGGPGVGAKVALGKPGKVSRKRRRVSFRVSCPASAVGGCAGKAAFKLKFVERGKKRTAKLKSVRFNLEPGAGKRVGRKMSRRLYKRLRRSSKRKLIVTATSKDSAGRSFKSVRRSKLKFSG